MKRLIYACIVLSSILFLIGCTATQQGIPLTSTVEMQERTVTAVSSSTSSPFPTIPATQTATPTSTTVPTEEPGTPTATATEMPDQQLTEEQCVTYTDNLELLGPVTGKLALHDRGYNRSYLSDIQTREIISLGEEGTSVTYIEGISPNQDALILADDENNYFVLNSDGNILRRLPKEIVSIYQWFDENTLLYFKEWDAKPYYSPPKVSVFYNLTTGVKTAYEPVYPNFGHMEMSWGNFGLTIYHRTKPLVVYPAMKDGKQSIILYDYERGEILQNIPVLTGATHTPQWSPDGQMLLLSGKFGAGKDGVDHEIYIYNTEGSLLYRTILANYPPREYFNAFSWSPDSQKIAFWISTLRNNLEQLAILDLPSKTVTSYCVFSKGWYGSFLKWSPDGQFVAVDGTNEEDGVEISFVTIVNPKNLFAYKHMEAEDFIYLYGWIR